MIRSELLFSMLLLAATACGGREQQDIDAAIPDASYDLNVHFGECCDRLLGGLGRPCTAAEIEAGPTQRFECPPQEYCGLVPGADSLPAEITCCGGKVPPALNSGQAVDVGCVPWPGGLEAAWGDCCYHASYPDGGDGGMRWGGVPGLCPESTPYVHQQCSPNQYCGLGPAPDGGPGQRCCGDRSQDHGTIDSSGLDPDCTPQYWQL